MTLSWTLYMLGASIASVANAVFAYSCVKKLNAVKLELRQERQVSLTLRAELASFARYVKRMDTPGHH